MADLEGLPFEVTHLGNLKDAGISLPTDEESVPPIATDGTLVHVDDGRLRLVIFQESQPPKVIRPIWAQDLRIGAAIYEPENRYLAIRTDLSIRICQLDSNRGQWEHQAPVFTLHEAKHNITFWKWVLPLTLVFCTSFDLVEYTLALGLGTQATIPLRSSPEVIYGIAANPDKDSFAILVKSPLEPPRSLCERRSASSTSLQNGRVVRVDEWSLDGGKVSYVMGSAGFVVVASRMSSMAFSDCV